MSKPKENRSRRIIEEDRDVFQLTEEIGARRLKKTVDASRLRCALNQ
jgi:hypothetical protein